MEEKRRRGRNNKRRGAAIEREIAKKLGGTRIVDNGEPGKSDIRVYNYPPCDEVPEDDDWLLHAKTCLCDTIIEVKSNQRSSPAKRVKAWEQAVNGAAKEGEEWSPRIIETYIDEGKRTHWLIQKLEI